MPNLHVSGIEQLGINHRLDGLVLCYYINQSAQLQILRSATIESWRFEQVVFPHERLLFKAPEMAHLNIYEVIAGTSVFLTALDCYSLRIQTGSPVHGSPVHGSPVHNDAFSNAADVKVHSGY
jgi:hypothetical protein